MNNRDIGKMGENSFEYLCNQVDITANSSNPDRYGWDYLLEFPKNNNSQLSLDMQDLPIECKVQVKASDTNSGKCQIKLSAMERLIKNSNPAFIYFVNFNKLSEPYESFLVHIDKNIIEQVLKKIRKNEVAQEKKELHKIKITIKYNESHKLDNICGIDLKKEIEKYITTGMKQYIKKKAHLLEKVGFSEQSMKIKMTIVGEDAVTDLVDMSLGLKNIDVPIAINETTMTRFGIELPFSVFPDGFKDVTVTIKPNIEDAILGFKDKNGRTLLKLELDMYRSSINIKDNFRIVLRNSISYFVLSVEKFEHKTSIKSYEDEFEFKEFYNYLKFFYICAKYSRNTLSMSIESRDLNIDKLDFGKYTSNSQEMLEYFSIIKKLKKVFDFLEIELKFNISLTTLSKLKPFIDVLFVLLFEHQNKINISFKLNDTEGIALSKIPDNGNIIVPMLIQINQQVFLIYIIYDSSISVIKKVEGKMSASKVNRYEIFELSIDKFNYEWVEFKHESIIESLKNDDTYAIMNKYIENFKLNEKLLK